MWNLETATLGWHLFDHSDLGEVAGRGQRSGMEVYHHNAAKLMSY